MQMNKLLQTSVGADLSCPPPIYRPSPEQLIPTLDIVDTLDTPDTLDTVDIPDTLDTLDTMIYLKQVCVEFLLLESMYQRSDAQSRRDPITKFIS